MDYLLRICAGPLKYLAYSHSLFLDLRLHPFADSVPHGTSMSSEMSVSDVSDISSALQESSAVGLADPSFSSTRREMLDLINRLHGTG